MEQTTLDTPQYFLYGGRKRIMFHSQSYLDRLTKNPASAYKEFKDSGHWFHWTNAEEVGSDIKKWLSSS